MVFVALLFLVIPAILYLANRGHAGTWGLIRAGEAMRGAGAYRGAPVSLWKRGSAPWPVRLAAISSFFLGQMVVPGGLAALVGLLVTMGMLAHGKAPATLVVLMLSAPTGLIVAVRLLVAGSAMLSRAPDAADKARLAARWAFGHNLVLITALFLAAFFDGQEVEVAVASGAYCLVSIAHAFLVHHAAASIDAYALRQAEDPAPVEDEAHLVSAG